MKEPTNQELNIMLENLTEKLDEKHADNQLILQRIEAQTMKTNGRVTELEKTKWLMYGAIAILTAIVLPIVFLLLKNINL